MRLVWGCELGEVGFQGILWVGRPLLSNSMTCRLWQCCVSTLRVGRAQQKNSGYRHTSVQSESHLGPHSSNSLFPCKSLVAPEQLTQCWCSERAGPSPQKSTHRQSPCKGCLPLPAATATASIPLNCMGPGSLVSLPPHTSSHCRVISYFSPQL